MEHLFSAWHRVSQQLIAARNVALFSDYDGTLAPIVESPDLAEMPIGVRELLEILARQPYCTVGIVSGRALADVRRRIGIKGIIYAGNHGLEIEGPGIRFVDPIAEELRPILHLMSKVLTRSMATISGALVENKGLSLSVHYRLAGIREEGHVRSAFDRVVTTARSLGKVKVTNGKKVLEVRPPVEWDKGRAISFLMDSYARRNRKSLALPIFLGDDLTDEDGFEVVHQRDGISVYIGEENTRSSARYFLRSPHEVRGFLARLLECRGVDRS